jgi:YggT family protein
MGLVQIVYSVLTGYMLLILLRWFAPWLELELDGARLRWIAGLTDPFIDKLRAWLPPLGPMDLSPLLALLIVWLMREITVTLIVQALTARSA